MCTRRRGAIVNAIARPIGIQSLDGISEGFCQGTIATVGPKPGASLFAPRRACLGIDRGFRPQAEAFGVEDFLVPSKPSPTEFPMLRSLKESSGPTPLGLKSDPDAAGKTTPAAKSSPPPLLLQPGPEARRRRQLPRIAPPDACTRPPQPLPFRVTILPEFSGHRLFRFTYPYDRARTVCDRQPACGCCRPL